MLSKVNWIFEKFFKIGRVGNTKGRGQFYLYLDGKMHQVPLDRYHYFLVVF